MERLSKTTQGGLCGGVAHVKARLQKLDRENKDLQVQLAGTKPSFA